MRGYALAVESTEGRLANVTAGDRVPVTFVLRNVRSVPVTITGYKASCRCTKVVGLPLVIPPGETRPIQTGIQATEADIGKSLSAMVMLYSDADSPPVFLTVKVDNVLARAKEVANKD